MSDKAFTTFQISKMCHVTHRTVLSWIKQGRIAGFRTPGGHSRVKEHDLKCFLKEYNIPFPDNMKDHRHDILIVDDEPEVLELLSKALSSDPSLNDKISIMTSSNGIDALMAIGKNPPDVVILDMYMPQLDGYEVCRRIRSNPDTQGIYIVAISGYYVQETEMKTREAGADLFMAKPFPLDALIKNISEFIVRGA